MPLPRTDRRRQRQGAVTVWVVASLGVIIAIVALGLDGGRMLEERRRGQAAAAAAALAAAVDLYNNYPANGGSDPNGTATQAALASAAGNGYANDGSASTVTVNIPPTSGPFAGQADHVEVIVRANLKGTFSAAIQGGDLSVQARAVARGRPRKVGATLMQSGGAAFSASANATVKVTGAQIAVNSADPAAYTQSGGSVQADAFAVVGGVSKADGTMNGPVCTGAAPTPDPFRNLPAPSSADCPIRSALPLVVVSSTVLQPGVYRGGILVSGEAVVTLAPGVYILEGGGMLVSGDASVSGSGVMVYNTAGLFPAGMIYATGNGRVSLSPPTDGTYAGVSIFQDRGVGQDIEADANGSFQVSGLVYAPAARFEVEGNSSVNVARGGLILRSLVVADSAALTVDSGKSLLRSPEVRLVE
jgi:hypothetical protein